MVAGVSVDYYTRVEQGRARNVSAQVIDALAQALKLDALERDYLYALAHPAAARAADAPPAKASAGVRAMVDALDPTPALLHGPFLEVLAVNRMGVRLFADFMAMPLRERNLARWTFLDPRARVVYPQWDVVAQQMVAILRRAAGPRADNPRLVALVAELTAASPDFACWWADHRIFRHTHGPKTIHHEQVGDLHLHYQSLIVPQDPDQYVVLYTAPPGSPAAASLAELAVQSEPASLRTSASATSRS